LDAPSRVGHSYQSSFRDWFAALLTLKILVGVDPAQRVVYLTNFLAHLVIQSDQSLLVFEFHGLFGKIRWQRFIAMAGIARDALLAFSQFRFVLDQRLLEFIDVHCVAP